MTSTAPDVIDRLVTAFRAALVDVDVLDGPDVSGASLPAAVTIGYRDDDAGVDAIEGTLDRDGMHVRPLREAYTINCAAAVLAADPPGGRRAAFALYQGLCDVLLADPSLDGLVLSVTPGTFNLTQRTDPRRGLIVRVVFGLDVDAYTQETP